MSNRSNSSNNSNNNSSKSSDIKEGDRVNFNIGQNELTGTVTEVLTSPSDVDGRIAHASKSDPRVAVQYDGTGTEIIRTLKQVEKIHQSGRGQGGQGSQGGEQGGDQSNEIQKGDKVAFHIGQNRLEGTIKNILTSPREVDGRIAHASEEEPRYVIHYEGTDADLIRTEGDVEKVDEEEGGESNSGSRNSGSSGSGKSGSSSSGGKSSSGGQGGQGQDEVHEGDRVKFNIGQNELEGTVTEVLTSPSDVDGRIAHASKSDPRVAVQYDGTGTEIIRTLKQVEKIHQGGQGDQNNEIQKGDRVAFHIGQNRLEGTIKNILTSPREVDGRIAHASEEEPRYVIHYDGTDTDIIRKEGDVEKMDEEEGGEGERMSTDQSGKRKREGDSEGSSQEKGGDSSKKGSKQPDSKKQKNSASSGRRKGAH